MKIKSITTNHQKEVYWQEELLEIEGVDAMKALCIYPEHTYQKVTGFGGAFTESSGYNLSLLSEKRKEEVLQGYFGEEGLCYDLCRTHINSCDFALGNYAYLEKEIDRDLTGFTIERDHKYLIPMIKRATEITKGELTLLASPWSPPAFMKSNQEMNHGGSLKREYYTMWADYMVRYLKEYEKCGIMIRYLTVQNEPQAVQTWDSCIYTAEEEKVFVKEFLGPALERAGYGQVKILIWDHNKEIMVERASEILSDEAARKYTAGVAFHWYSGDHFESVALVKEMYPEMELIFTEGCVEYSRFAGSDEIDKAQMYAHDIIGNFNAGMNGYIDWNLLLDELGGPNHVKNYCASPVMCNTKMDTVEKRLSYYYIGHFSRYVHKGARRIAVSRYTDRLEVSGFINPDGERVLIIMNRTGLPVEFSVKEREAGGKRTLEGHTIQTICYYPDGLQ